ncbi:MAG: hypothetical protein AAGI69_06685 [Cyanobacteria bacterium P01_H01_bin.21]
MYQKDRRFRVLFPLSVFMLLTITACEGTSSNTAADSVDTSQTLAVSVDDPDALSTEEMTGMALALSGEGVLIVDQQSGTTRTIPFETDIATSQTAISATLGEPTERTENSECGAGPMSFVTWSNGFTINVMQDQFVGWTVDEKIENLTTVNGVGVGSTLAELEENYDIAVIESSLGIEFFDVSNSLFGLLDANEPEGTITYLWAGIACNFR